jgi:hypothetical protein
MIWSYFNFMIIFKTFSLTAFHSKPYDFSFLSNYNYIEYESIRNNQDVLVIDICFS